MKQLKYQFTTEVTEQLNGFEDYLFDKKNKAATIKQKSNYAGYFLQWLENERLLPADVRYNDMLIFIEHCKTNNKSKRMINRILHAVRIYYEYRKTENKNAKNPANNLFLRGEQKRMPSGISPIKALDEIYQKYAATATIGHQNPETALLKIKRNQIILGLLIYQAVTTGELHQLQPQDLKLREGKIYIPSTNKTASRTLELKPHQIIDLQEYTTDTRTKIIAQITKKKPSRKPDNINFKEIENRLLFSMNGSLSLKNSLLHLFKQIKKINPEIESAKQIRTSVIVNWLKHHNLRQVQHMAGHRYVSSTERYRMNNLENLKEKINQLHPLG